VCFSVNGSIAHPPSLINIFKELKTDAGKDISKSGNLEHPSPLSADRGYWFGNKHFSKANVYLKEKDLKAISW